MHRSRRVSGSVAAVVAGVALLSLAARGPVAAQIAQPKPLDVIYVPTPPNVVAKMLTMASVGPNDVVYDLGSGDGRIVVTAVRDFGAKRAVGYELDPVRLKEANENARVAKVADRVQFVAGDLFEADLSEATVITTYLLPVLNERLVPTFRKLKPGTRIVTHNYDLTDDWKPVQREVLDGHSVYFFRVPGR